MRNYISIIITLLLLGTTVIGQVSQPVVKATDSLSFMLGTWTGSGWIRMGPNMQTFQLTEIISSKVDGKVISIDGVGVTTDSVTNETKKVHDAFGVVYFDSVGQSFRISAFSSASTKKDVKFEVDEKVLTWSFKTDNGGVVKFTEDFSTDDKWITVGEYSAGGNRWFQFMEYNLDRNPLVP